MKNGFFMDMLASSMKQHRLSDISDGQMVEMIVWNEQ